MSEDQDGLTLIEMMVAIMIVGVILTAMASVAINSMMSIQSSERVVDSTQLGNEIIERYLALPYDLVGLTESDASGFWGGEFNGELIAEVDEEDEDDPRVPAALDSANRGGVDFEVRTAITWVDDPETDHDQDYKRITVQLAWEVRGATNTARTEALRAEGGDVEGVTVSVQPDVLELRDDGAVKDAFLVEVQAERPQSDVDVFWARRSDGAVVSRTLTSTDQLRWTITIDDNSLHARFLNGGNLLTVVSKPVDGGTVETETRALFLHPLALPQSRFSFGIEPIRVGSEGVCDDLVIQADVVGALQSDPFTVRLDDDEEATEYAFAADGSLDDGAHFRRTVESEELDEYLTHDPTQEVLVDLDLYLEFFRATDPVEEDGVLREWSTAIEVQHLGVGEAC